jgi:hypothetical protein
MIMKRSKETVDIIYKTANSIQDKIDKVGKIIDNVKDKLENTGSYFGLILENIIRLVGIFEKKKEDKTKAKK